jgi:four helix bundle protein
VVGKEDRQWAIGDGLWVKKGGSVMSTGGFKNLLVWQKAKSLAVTIYKISDTGRLVRDFGLRDQLRRSAVSIASNIAEGDERGTDRESIRFFYIAKGSLAELRTQTQIAYEIGYLEKYIFEDMEATCEELGRMLGKLIKVRQKSFGL